MGDFIYKSIKECFEKQQLPDSFNRGIITCLPKSGKTRDVLQNWRPISLLNNIYKLISIILTKRVKSVLPDLIHLDQKGLMKKRSITDKTRLMMGKMLEMEAGDETGLI